MIFPDPKNRNEGTFAKTALLFPLDFRALSESTNPLGVSAMLVMHREHGYPVSFAHPRAKKAAPRSSWFTMVRVRGCLIQSWNSLGHLQNSITLETIFVCRWEPDFSEFLETRVQTLPELPQKFPEDFPRTFLTIDFKSNPELPRSSPDFPGSPLSFPTSNCKTMGHWSVLGHSFAPNFCQFAPIF